MERTPSLVQLMSLMKEKSQSTKDKNSNTSSK